MTYTSAQANKLLKKLHDEHAALLDRENRSKDFRAAMGEDVESVRPAYDYGDTQNRLAELEQRIRKVKHAINVFNATHVIPLRHYHRRESKSPEWCSVKWLLLPTNLWKQCLPLFRSFPNGGH